MNATPAIEEKPESAASASLATDLCSACGLCCDGTLFYSVVLQPKDSPKQLIGLGLKLQRKKKQYSFLQPCPAFCGTHCSIYQHRPERCRAFECRQLRGVMAGEVREEEALSRIRAAKEKADEVKALMWQMGEHNVKRNILRRYESICARVPDLAEEPQASESKKLLAAALCDLEEILKAHFREPVRAVEPETLD